MSSSTATEASSASDSDSFFASLLKPGSSLDPTFLLVLDGAFATLLSIFIALLVLLNGNIHIVVLIGVELCLWASVKWFVKELKSAQAQQPESSASEETRKQQ